ncbi:hypothetical protein [Couchioplanes azureus]|uniref:hypothetical protein n=1 Tax=Couchioplanes caeruleus TaxID=56438 RepID=UPI001670E8A9|nr:hypothetical protein [Couchioplanes caeruleus]GGQ75113.1 hypothetical protein GCM10010166_51310 [Couchioplanes caeruleus subsp. azureus]
MSDVNPEQVTTQDGPGPAEAGRERADRSHAEQEHPEQDAHGGSMAPGLVDDTGHPTGDSPPAE